MRMDDMVLVSVDDHAVEPREMFEHHMPAHIRDLAPRNIRVGTRDRWVFEDSFVPMIGMNAVAGRPRHEYGMEAGSFDEMREAAWHVDKRVEDMNANGVLGSLCFPSLPGFAGHNFLKYKDRDVALAVVRAYNDWHFEDWATCFIDESFGVRNVEDIGEDMITWECDYPHADTTWPQAPEFLWSAISGMPDRAIDKLTHENAMRLYHFNPLASRSRAVSTVGALRALATHVDTTPKEHVSGVKPGHTSQRVTSGDINKMMADMAAQS